MADDSLLEPPGGRFPPARRSALRAVAGDDPAERARSFEILVRASWNEAEEARDLTQSSFAPARFAMEQARDERRRKRGGGAVLLSLDLFGRRELTATEARAVLGGAL